jgi:two-component system sensor histidine kinase KdpD
VRFRQRTIRLLLALTGAVIVTFVAHSAVRVNATTVGFAYLLWILVIASVWGFFEAAAVSVVATLFFNFYFLPPVGTLTIADPQNWVALFSFLATSLIASRLSTTAKARALEAIERRQDQERLYSFSRAILLTDRATPFPQQLIEKCLEIFNVEGVALYERRSHQLYRAGAAFPAEVEAQLSEIMFNGPSVETKAGHVVMSLSLGAEPVASMALRGAIMPESLLQGIANLVAIGLERARAQDLSQQIEAARQSEELRTTLIDAMAHEFKTPLTLIKATTTSLLANPNQALETRTEQLKAADGEAEHLRQLIDDAVELARLDTAHIEVHPEISTLQEILVDVIASMQSEVEDHPVSIQHSQQLPQLAFDKRLMKLAIKQLVDNALKYSPVEKEVQIATRANNGFVNLEITDFGHGIPAQEQSQIFERFYRSPSVKDQIPGSGLGLSIAQSIVKAHNGELTVTSQPGRTTFRVTLPVLHPEAI